MCASNGGRTIMIAYKDMENLTKEQALMERRYRRKMQPTIKHHAWNLGEDGYVVWSEYQIGQDSSVEHARLP